ncbi:MAG TPA: DUF308 domain-containing protein [Chitinophagaceae bacterium]
MLRFLFRKWWVLLIQGILLILLAILIFNNPLDVLAGLSIWVGILILFAGIAGVFAWFGADKNEREGGSLLWSIITLLFGIILLSNLLVTMKALTILFGVWLLIGGIHLIRSGLALRRETSSPGLLIIVTGVLAVIVSLATIFNIGTGAVTISVLLGLQVLLIGIAFAILGITKKRVVEKLKDRYGS